MYYGVPLVFLTLLCYTRIVNLVSMRFLTRQFNSIFVIARCDYCNFPVPDLLPLNDLT